MSHFKCPVTPVRGAAKARALTKHTATCPENENAATAVLGAIGAIRLTLPYPPSVNHYWARNRNGGMRVGKRGAEFRLEAILASRAIVRGLGRPAISGRLRLRVETHQPDRRRHDLDNTLKAICDSLGKGGAGIYLDDEQIDHLEVVRGAIDRVNPRVEVEVVEL